MSSSFIHYGGYGHYPAERYAGDVASARANTDAAAATAAAANAALFHSTSVRHVRDIEVGIPAPPPMAIRTGYTGLHYASEHRPLHSDPLLRYYY